MYAIAQYLISGRARVTNDGKNCRSALGSCIYAKIEFSMSTRSSTILLVSDDAGDARMVRKALADTDDNCWVMERARTLAEAIQRLHQPGPALSAVILDLFLPDSQGMVTIQTLSAAAPLAPVLVLSNRKNEDLAEQSTLHGAQDHILRDHLDDYWLPRILHSVMDHKMREEVLFLEKERALVTLNSIGDAVLSADIENNVCYLNLVAEEMTGWSCQEAIGRPLAEVFQIIDGATREPAPNPMLRAIKENKSVDLNANCILVRRDGYETPIEDSTAPIHDRGGNITGAVIVFHDVSAARAITQKMAYLAKHDFLTELPNRMLLSDRVANSIALARRHNKQRAVLFLDLDGFKAINDTLGHVCGDKLLQSVAQRLVASVRGSDTVSRHGGDEFVVLLAEIAHITDAALSAEKILQALAAPYSVDGNVIQITVSIGISIYPSDGIDPETLIRCADAAMYRAKDMGRNNYQFYMGNMNVPVTDRQIYSDNVLQRTLE